MEGTQRWRQLRCWASSLVLFWAVHLWGTSHVFGESLFSVLFGLTWFFPGFKDVYSTVLCKHLPFFFLPCFHSYIPAYTSYRNFLSPLCAHCAICYAVVLPCLCVCVFVPTFVLVYTSPHPPFHSTTQEKEDEAEEQRSPKRNYYWFNHIISRKHFRPR